MSILWAKENIRIRKRDWLLVIGLCLAAMTDLRIWKVGPSELLCFLWGLRYLPKKKYRMNILSSFFARFLGAMLIGSIIGDIVAPEELVASDLLTWLFLTFISLAMYEGLKENTKDYNERLLFRLCLCTAMWYLFLYFYSVLVSRAFLGARLWYRGVRFTGGAKNPHQVAVLMCGITFCFVRSIIKKRYVLISIIGMLTSIFVEIQTASSTGIMSIYMGFMATIMILTFYKMRSTTAKISAIILEIIIGLSILVIIYPIVYRYLYNWISSDANGIGRLELFAQIGNAFRKSPLFGLGPGMHATWGIQPKEFHNTYLEILAATGLFGSISFVLFTIKSIRKLLDDPTFIPVMVSIYAYGLAGFAMRRLAYWGVFVFILVIAEQIGNCTSQEN